MMAPSPVPESGVGSCAAVMPRRLRRPPQNSNRWDTALWIPDIGGDVFGAVEHLLTATSTSTIATGILNLWMHTAEETAAQHASLTSQYGPRFFVGIGVSPAP